MKRHEIDEGLRLQSLHALGILDTPTEDRFDRYTRLAVAAFAVPIAVVSLVDAQRQWFKSCIGLPVSETPREVAFCSHAITAQGVMVVHDARLDARFCDNPLVTGGPQIRFYAGHPIHALNGFAIGTLCVIDTVARQFGVREQQLLADLAAMVEEELNKHVHIDARNAAEHALQVANAVLEEKVNQRTEALEERNTALRHEIGRRNAVEMTLRQSDDRIQNIITTSFAAFISTDARGHILEWNASAERIFGWCAAEALGVKVGDLLVPARLRAAHHAGMDHFRRNAHSAVMNRPIEMPAMTKSGAEIIVEMTANVFDCDGHMHFGAFLHDVSARLSVQRALEQKQELLDAIMHTVDVAVIACDADGVPTLFNRAARQFHGLSAHSTNAATWNDCYDLLQLDGETPLLAHEMPLVRALSGEQVKGVAMVIAPRGLRRRTVLWSGRLLVSASGERLGAVVAMKDITELNEWQQRLHQNEQRLRAITENLPTLIGQVDHAGRFAFLNARALDFYGQSAEQLLGQPIEDACSAADRAFLRQHISTALSGQRVEFEADVLVGARRMVYHACFIPHCAASGEPDGFFVMAFDITARREGEIMQAESEERLRTITDNVPALISYLDQEGRFRFANAMHRQWTGIGAEAMLGRTMGDVYGDHYVQARASALARCRAGKVANLELPVEFEGAYRMLSSTYIPHLRDGKVVGTYILSSDSTAIHADRRRLHDLANSDTLTGLPNRRCYEQAMSVALQRPFMSQGIALMYLDLDHFKDINDTLGHAAGDQVLTEFGRRIKRVLRSTDMLARLAGDEFTVILENVDSPKDAALIGAKILAALAPPFLVGTSVLAVSASIGIAFTNAVTNLGELNEAADAALYQAKRAGRGCFRVATLPLDATKAESA